MALPCETAKTMTYSEKRWNMFITKASDEKGESVDTVTMFLFPARLDVFDALAVLNQDVDPQTPPEERPTPPRKKYRLI